MRIPLLPYLLFLVLCVLVDIDIYKALKSRCRAVWPSKVQLWSAVAFIALGIMILFMPRRDGDEWMLITIMWMLFAFMTIYICKALYVIVDLLSRLPLLWHRRRIRWIGRAGALLAVITFCSMWWGALVNRFNIDVVERTVAIKGLPEAFDGFKIAQISDLHVGTYGDDVRYVRQVVAKVNALKPDLIVFTGDIVNRRTTELLPFADVLSGLHAPYGVISILGNHDYGDYFEFAAPGDKEKNNAELHRLQREKLGWNLLLNQHTFIHKDADSIAVIGVENIGDPPFLVYGDLQKAYSNLGDANTKILLSHTPSHWVDSICNDSTKKIDLTLSGHTHAMQIEIAGLSPAALRYKTWGGLYSDPDSLRQLYVNIGIGTVGMPMRLGATPEITLLTLEKRK